MRRTMSHSHDSQHDEFDVTPYTSVGWISRIVASFTPISHEIQRERTNSVHDSLHAAPARRVFLALALLVVASLLLAPSLLERHFPTGLNLHFTTREVRHPANCPGCRIPKLPAEK